MAIPNIRYASTSDGGAVGLHVIGIGPPVVTLFPYHVNHLTLNWQVPLHRGAFEYLAGYFTVINLDFRGAGTSRRRLSSLSLDMFVEDIQAVLSFLQIDRVGVCAMGDAALMACQFALRFPDRVSSMVFIAAGESEANHRVLSLRRDHPHLEAKMRGALIGGLTDGDNSLALSAVAQGAVTSEMLGHWERLVAENRLSSIAGQVETATLCLQAAEDELVGSDAISSLVNMMPKATLRIVSGRSAMDIWRDRSAVQAIRQFLSVGFGVEQEVAKTHSRRRTRATSYPGGLSEREAEVIRLLAAGRTNLQIAEGLFVSLNTVAFHLRNIFNKTGASNRTEAALFAHRHRISAPID